MLAAIIIIVVVIHERPSILVCSTTFNMSLQPLCTGPQIWIEDILVHRHLNPGLGCRKFSAWPPEI